MLKGKKTLNFLSACSFIMLIKCKEKNQPIFCILKGILNGTAWIHAWVNCIQRGVWRQRLSNGSHFCWLCKFSNTLKWNQIKNTDKCSTQHNKFLGGGFFRRGKLLEKQNEYSCYTSIGCDSFLLPALRQFKVNLFLVQTLHKEIWSTLSRIYIYKIVCIVAIC